MHDETTLEAVRWRMVRELEKARDAAWDTLRQARDSHERADELAGRAEEAIRARNREEVAEWARGVLEDENAVLLALGTTGLIPPVDIVEVVALNTAGETVVSERVRPATYEVLTDLPDVEETERREFGPVEISPEATAMHGHAAESLADAQTLAELYPRLRESLRGRRVIVYNSEYVEGVLDQTLTRYSLWLLSIPTLTECAMKAYARLEGTWSLTDETYSPVRLPDGDGTPAGNARALYELLRTLADGGPVPAADEERAGRGGRRVEGCDTTEEDFESIPF